MEETRRLKDIVKDVQHYIDWDQVATQLKTRRTPFACFSRYQIHLSTSHRRKGWSDEENERMVELIHAHQYRDLNEINWKRIQIHLEGRSKVQIYSHWKYHQTKPDRSKFSEYEDALIDAAFSKGLEFGTISELVFCGKRTTPQIRERCQKMMRHGLLDMDKWTSNQDRLIRQHFGEHHSKLRNAEISQHFNGRSSAQLSIRYHYLKFKSSKQTRRSSGLIRKQLPQFCAQLGQLIDVYIPGQPDELWKHFEKLLQTPVAQREHKPLGRPKKQPLTDKEQLRRVLSPLFPVNLHQMRKTTFPGDGRQHGLVLTAVSRLLNCDFSVLETLDHRQPQDLSKCFIMDGIDTVNVLPLQNMIEMRHELPSSDERQPHRDESVLMPPTIHTIVGLRGLQLQSKLIRSSARAEDENDNGPFYDGKCSQTTDARLLSRLISLFFWPAVMSMSKMPESFSEHVSETVLTNDSKTAINGKRARSAANSRPAKKTKK